MIFTAKTEQELYEAIDRINQTTEEAMLILKEREYELDRTISFRRGNVTVKGNHARLRGSRKIPFGDGDLVTIDAAEFGISDLGRLGEGPYDDFWFEYDIPKPHMIDEGPGAELFFENRVLPMSRYPEEGFLTITKALGKTRLPLDNGTAEGIFLCDDENVRSWDAGSEALAVGYWGNDWATQRHRVKSVSSEGVIEVEPPYHAFGYRDGEMYNNKDGGKFYFINVVSHIKNPGEWAIDRKEGKIYLKPLPNQEYVNVSVCGNVFELCGVQNIRISDLEISECRKCGFLVEDSTDCVIENCTVYHTGAWGIVADRCRNMKVRCCEVFGTAGGGIAVSGGNRENLISSENIIIGCTVHDIARWHKTYLAGIEINGVGCIVRENKLYDMPHFGLDFQGNDHIIEHNEIKNVCMESNDAGAIYAGRDWTCRGNIIRYNYIHELRGRDGYGCIALYFDDGMSSAEVYGNVIANVYHPAIELGGGRDFQIFGNTFVNCQYALKFDNRVMTWLKPERLMQHLGEVDYQSPVWKEAYPELSCILDNDCEKPLGNRFCDNTIIGGEGLLVTSEEVLSMLEMHGNTHIKHEMPHFEHEYKDTESWIFPPVK